MKALKIIIVVVLVAVMGFGSYKVFGMFREKSSYSELSEPPSSEIDAPCVDEKKEGSNQAEIDSLEIMAKEKEEEIRRKEDLEKLKEEKKLYDKCMGKNGTVSSCDQFLKKYPGSINKDEIIQKRQDLLDSWEQTLYKRCFKQDATVSTCDKYLNDSYIKELKDNLTQHFEDVKKRKEELSQKKQYVKPVPKPTQESRLEQGYIRNIADLFEALGDVHCVMKGTIAFQEKYIFMNPNNSTKLREITNRIIDRATGVVGRQKGKSLHDKMRDYSRCYEHAKKQPTPFKRLEELEDLLRH